MTLRQPDVVKVVSLRRTVTVLLILASLSVLSACGTGEGWLSSPGSTDRAVTRSNATTPGKLTPTNEQPALGIPGTPTPGTSTANLLTSKDAFGTRLAEQDNAMKTRVALTAAPTITDGPLPVYPTYTPVMGMLPGEPYSGKNPDNPQVVNGWRGIINGETVEISAGREGKAVDPLQGVVIVNIWHRSIDTYKTPQRVGPVLISSVNVPLFTLVSMDGQYTFAFDIATRQWISR